MTLHSRLLAAALRARACGAPAHAAVTADEAKALGTTLTADRRREGRQQGRHDPRVHRRPDHAAGGLQGRRRHPARPVRRREAALRDRRQEHGAARRPADRGREGAAAEAYPTFRIDVYPTHRTVAFPKFVADNTREERDAGEDAPTTAARCEGAHAGFPFPIPKNGYEAMWNHLVRFNGQAYEAKYRNLNVDASGRADAGHRGHERAGVPVLGRDARPRPTPTGASSSPTPARRAAPARRCCSSTRSTSARRTAARGATCRASAA